MVPGGIIAHHIDRNDGNVVLFSKRQHCAHNFAGLFVVLPRWLFADGGAAGKGDGQFLNIEDVKCAAAKARLFEGKAQDGIESARRHHDFLSGGKIGVEIGKGLGSDGAGDFFADGEGAEPGAFLGVGAKAEAHADDDDGKEQGAFLDPGNVSSTARGPGRWPPSECASYQAMPRRRLKVQAPRLTAMAPTTPMA